MSDNRSVKQRAHQFQGHCITSGLGQYKLPDLCLHCYIWCLSVKSKAWKHRKSIETCIKHHDSRLETDSGPVYALQWPQDRMLRNQVPTNSVLNWTHFNESVALLQYVDWFMQLQGEESFIWQGLTGSNSWLLIISKIYYWEQFWNPQG